MVMQKVYFKGLLANVDSTIMDYNFEHGFTVEEFTLTEAMQLLSSIEKIPQMNVSQQYLMNYPCHHDNKVYFVCNEIEADLEVNEYGTFKELSQDVMKFSGQSVHNYFKATLQLMRLFKEGNICMPANFYYIEEQGIPRSFIRGYTGKHIQESLFTCNADEIKIFDEFKDCITFPFTIDYLELAYKNYEESYMIGDRNFSFLLLMIGMEVLFNPGDAELNYRISRNAATLIGKDKEEADEIYMRLKKNLYSKRSNLVHNGKARLITIEDIIELRGYLRRSLIEISTLGLKKDDLLKLLTSSGFGERPWEK